MGQRRMRHGQGAGREEAAGGRSKALERGEGRGLSLERAAGNVKGRGKGRKEGRNHRDQGQRAPRDFSPAPHLQKSLLVLRMNLQPK